MEKEVSKSNKKAVKFLSEKYKVGSFVVLKRDFDKDFQSGTISDVFESVKDGHCFSFVCTKMGYHKSSRFIDIIDDELNPDQYKQIKGKIKKLRMAAAQLP